MESTERVGWRLLALWGALLLVCHAVPVEASSRSNLSRWLGDVATPEIRERLRSHPRFAGQPVELVRVEPDGLSEALVTLLTINLKGREGIQLASAIPERRPPLVVPARIDSLDCGAASPKALRLLVSVAGESTSKVQVTLSLTDGDADSPAAASWYWRGRLNPAERDVLKQPARDQLRSGTLTAPWTDSDVESAAQHLHRQLACALRPQVKSRLQLAWPKHTPMPAVMTDVVNHSRHLLGNYGELVIGDDSPDYVLSASLTPFQGDTWQLWLHGAPQSASLPPVQAVTYFRTRSTVTAAAPLTPVPASFTPPVMRGDPLEFLRVEMLDATQSERGGRRADLQVQLLIENTSEWPIDYGFRVSGGHYQHCIPEPGNYRHDGFGRLKGTLEPGESRVRDLVIQRVQHRPNPWSGPRRCAGFRSLGGFERFAIEGDTVTDYVRWSQ